MHTPLLSCARKCSKTLVSLDICKEGVREEELKKTPRALLAIVFTASIILSSFPSVYALDNEPTPQDLPSVSDAATEQEPESAMSQEEPVTSEPIQEPPLLEMPLDEEAEAAKTPLAEPMLATAQATADQLTAQNLALGLAGTSFGLEMEGAGTDLDPATKDVSIREKEASILSRLTDGVYGSGQILDGAWNGSGERSKYYEAYRQIDRAITLDLGQMSNIERLTFHMQEGLGWGISAPSMVTYFLSEDGVTFHRVGRVSSFDAVADADATHFYSETSSNGTVTNCQSYYYTLSDLNYNARYVKVTFELTGTWAFADELEVWGAAESATAEALPNTPGTDYEVVNHYATTTQSKGIQHEALAYAGYYVPSVNGALKTSEKTVDELLSVVGYVDEDGNVTGKFFESVTFLSHGYSPNLSTREDNTDYHWMLYNSSAMTSNPDAAKSAATVEDWQDWRNFIFDYSDGTDAAYNMDALNEAVGQPANRQLGQRQHRKRRLRGLAARRSNRPLQPTTCV